MERVERAQRHRLEDSRSRTNRLADLHDRDLRDNSFGLRHKLRDCPSYGPDDFDLDDRARELVGVLAEQFAQRATLGLLDHELPSADESR